MIAKFSEYIDALQIIHKNDDFWVIDNKLRLKYNNTSNYSLESIKVINKQQRPDNLMDYLTKNQRKSNIISELVVFSNEINPDYLLLLAIHPIIDNNSLLGYFLILQGTVDEFEKSILLNLTLHKDKPLTQTAINLKEREKEILYFILRGKSYKEIAAKLSEIYHKRIAPTTISSIVCNSLYKKLNVLNMFELKKRIIELNLVNHIPPSLFCNK
ncbi:MAG: helix-turn-helix transcriptional regulator [Neisseriaceae bacterium]|jgi:hypothetical protein